MLANDVEHLVNVVGGMNRDRQVALLRRSGGLAHQGDRAGLDLARHENAAHPVAVGALMTLDEFERQGEFALARCLVQHTHELAPLAADPAAAVEARTEIGADAEFSGHLKQRLLNAQLAAELDERGDAVADELGDGEAGVEHELLGRRAVIGAGVARIAADPGALARHADLQERLAEIVAPADVGNEPVRGAVAGMDVRVDETRRDQLVARIDLALDRSVEALAHEQHGAAFIDQLGIAPERMAAARMADQPAALDARAHGSFLAVAMHP